MKVNLYNSIISKLLLILVIIGIIPVIAFALNVNTNADSSDTENFTNGDLDAGSSFNDSEQVNYNDSDISGYDNSEQYFTDDWSYFYDSGISDLDIIRDLYYLGVYIFEPAENIHSKELAIRNIIGGNPVRFDFSQNATSITFIEFCPLMTFRKTTSTALVLNDISALVQNQPAGRLYHYIDIFVGNKGAGRPSSVKNGSIGFKVEKAWIKNNNVNISNITLQRYNNSWVPLHTEKTGENSDYVFFKSKTPGFFFFAITADMGKENENYSEEDENFSEYENYSEEDENFSEDENYLGEDENYLEEDENYLKEEINNSEDIKNYIKDIDESCSNKTESNNTKNNTADTKNCPKEISGSCSNKTESNKIKNKTTNISNYTKQTDVIDSKKIEGNNTKKEIDNNNKKKNLGDINKKKNIDEKDSKKNVDENDSKKNVDEDDSKKNVDENDSKKNIDENDSKKNIDENDSKKNIDVNDTNKTSSINTLFKYKIFSNV